MADGSARDDGKVPRSPELAVAAGLLGAALVLAALGPALASNMRSIVASGLSASGQSVLDGGGFVPFVRMMGLRAMGALMAWVATLAGVSLVIGALQARGVFSAKPLAPQIARMNPLANFTRIAGPQSAIELLKSLAKLAVVGIAVRVTLRSSWTRLMALPQETAAALVPLVFHTAVQLLLVSGLCYLALAAGDYAWQLWRHEQDLRMSKHELKQESREMDGDPLTKQRMRSLSRARSRRQMFRDVPKADVVITNPTHIAVALRYDPLECPAPVIVAMGQRKVAERIKRIARESGIPTIENKPLARALLAASHVGAMIPAELYIAVAEVLAFVIRRRILRGRPLAEVVA